MKAKYPNIIIMADCATLEEAVAAYGDYDAAKSAPDFGRYVFVKSATLLTLLTDADNIVTSVSYSVEG